MFNGLNHRDKLIEIEGLGDVTIGMEVVGPDNVLLRLGGRDDYDGCTSEHAIALDLRQHLPSVLLGQVEIKQYQVGGRFGLVFAFMPEKGHGFYAIVDDVQVDLKLGVFKSLLGEAHIPGLSSTSKISTGFVPIACVICCTLLVPPGDRKIESASLAGLRFKPHAAAVALDYLPGNGKAYSRAGVLIAMQTLEYQENALEKLGIDAYAVVFHGKNPFAILQLSSDKNARRFRAMKFNGVANKILKDLHQVAFVSHHLGQVVMVDDAPRSPG